MSTQPITERNKGFRWRTFGLRALLVLVTLCAILFGYVSLRLAQIRSDWSREQDAIAEIRRKLPDPQFQSEPIDTWLHPFVLDAEQLDRVVEVRCGWGVIEIEDLETLRKFANLRRFDCDPYMEHPEAYFRFQEDLIRFYETMPKLQEHTRRGIESALGKPTRWRCINTPLINSPLYSGEVFAGFFEDAHDIEMALDSSAHELARTTSFTYDPQGTAPRRPLKQILDAMLEPIGLDHQIQVPYLMIVPKE